MASTPPAPQNVSSSSPLRNALSPISLTASSLGSHLLPSEEVLSLCSHVGLYAEANKSPHQQNGTTYLTSHRIIYVDEQDPRGKSGYLNLADVKYTEYFRGFLKSSPKVILGLSGGGSSSGGGDATRSAEIARLQDEMAGVSVASASKSTPPTAPPAAASSRWLCPVCGFSNGDAGEGGAEACQLCGVKRDPAASTSAVASAVTQRKTDKVASPSPPSPSPSPSPSFACPTCTFLNHPSMSRCEVCDSALGTEVVPPSAPTAATQPSPPPAVAIPQPHTVKLSFRKGGDRAFYDALTTAMRRGAWKRGGEVAAAAAAATSVSRPSSRGGGKYSPLAQHRSLVDVDGRSSTPASASSGATTPVPPPVIGIEGLLSSYSQKSASDTSQMSDALKDLKALMGKAKDMVDLAEGLEARLRKREREAEMRRGGGGGDGEDGEDAAADSEEATAAAATLIRSSLVKLGLPAPAITKEMAKSEEQYHRELARELAYVLLGGEGGAGGGDGRRRQQRQSGLMGQGSVGSDGNVSNANGSAAVAAAAAVGRGIVGLDEVWCVWNRLRGVALIPPSHLLASTRYLPHLTSPSIRLRTFSNGLRVLSTSHYDDEAVARRVVRLLAQRQEDDEVAESMRLSEADAGEGGDDDKGDNGNALFSLPPPPPPSAPASAYFFGSGMSTLEIAQAEGISLLLIQQLLVAVEALRASPIVRDNGGGGAEVRWYRNRFQELARRGGVIAEGQ